MEYMEKQRGIPVHEIDPTYSKGLLGRLRHVLDHGELQIVGGMADGKVAKAHHFMKTLPPLPFTLQQAPLEYAALSVEFAQAVGPVTLAKPSGLSEERYIGEIGGLDIHNLPAIALDLTPAANKSPRTAVRLVYGATEQMPFRALSYLAPALVYLDGIQKAKIHVPQLQVVFTHAISSRLNGLDLEKTRQESIKLAEVARDYVSEFFPDLTDSVTFFGDTPLEKGSEIREHLLYVARQLQENGSRTMLNDLSKRGNNGATRLDAFYGAAHVLFHDTDLPESLQPLFPDQSARIEAHNIISIGGYQEQFFYKLRHSVKPHLDRFKQVKTAQFFTRHRVPPYYMARGGDISLEDVLKGTVSEEPITQAARYDIDYLQTVSSYRGDLQAFLERQREKYE